MKISSTTKKVLMWLPVGLGLSYAGWAYRASRKSKTENNLPPAVDPKKGETIKPEAIKETLPTCKYPLKKGSKGPCVKQLQTALINKYGSALLPKYGADGDWGTETDNAIKAKLNKSSIADEFELIGIVTSLSNQQQSSSATSARQDRALLVGGSFKVPGNWNVIRKTTWTLVIDNYGSYNSTGKVVTLNAGQKLNTSDYRLVDITSSGFLIIEVESGTMAGLYSASPFDLVIN